MKKRDLFWVNRILWFLTLIVVFAIISFWNIVQFNNSYMQEEREELYVSKRQIEWAITPMLKNHDIKMLQKYCDDFKDEDVEFRIFDEDKNLLATTNPNNKTELLAKDSKILSKKYNSLRIYHRSMKDRKIGIREKIFVNSHKYYLELTVSQADVMKSILKAQRGIIIFMGICLLLFIIGLTQIFYILARSFNKLETSVIEVSNGNLDTEIEIPELDLLKELTLSIKKMTRRLKMQIERLAQLEQYKSEFLQNITHEIKTPITAINSAIELIEANDSIQETDQECFNIIQFQVKSINKLVNDIFALSEIEVEKFNENKSFEKFNFNTIIKNTIDNFSHTELEINFVENCNINYLGNPELVSVAISNLILNAIKYSNSKTLDVILEENDLNIVLKIKDYGVGIAKEHLNHLFERFYRVDKARSRNLGGTGLGLSIVKNVVGLHNGEVSVESELDKYTQFTIILPKERIDE